jgi:hypothetical protein
MILDLDLCEHGKFLKGQGPGTSVHVCLGSLTTGYLHRVHLLTSSTDVRRSLQLPKIQTEVAEPKNAFASVLFSLFVGEQVQILNLTTHPPGFESGSMGVDPSTEFSPTYPTLYILQASHLTCERHLYSIRPSPVFGRLGVAATAASSLYFSGSLQYERTQF